ncbi:hypothetical protein AB0N99_30650 [Streptomyces sp. NPDC093272]|uniref:hypothetical protein n=1 Tax=Streptomyces sp. NPDC093272 TaxID=3154981 RepID=UPI00343BE804
MTDKIRTPWTSEQVQALNDFQQRGAMHPFTCGREHPGQQSPTLDATHAGWICPDPMCTYEQDWAHAFMADPAAWPKPWQQLTAPSLEIQPYPQTAPNACRTTQHCAAHGWCRRCNPAFAATMSKVNIAVQRSGVGEEHWGPLYEAIGKALRDDQPAPAPAGPGLRARKRAEWAALTPDEQAARLAELDQDEPGPVAGETTKEQPDA